MSPSPCIPQGCLRVARQPKVEPVDVADLGHVCPGRTLGVIDLERAEPLALQPARQDPCAHVLTPRVELPQTIGNNA
eukprot:12900593-Prorocentrum_lima.AAC.1